ncbi:MAG: hypothetical protein AAF480_05175 [Actinomycetota bacterium]
MLRKLVTGTAKMNAGFWSEVARLAEPARAAVSDGDAGDPETVVLERDEPVAEPPPQSPAEAPPAEGVLVPLDTWTKVMDQLGHLHQAGQDLAEARERAARAETQVEFLKQQLTDEKAKRSKPTAPKPVAAEPAPAPTPPPEPAVDLRVASRARVASARNRVSGWLRTD